MTSAALKTSVAVVLTLALCACSGMTGRSSEPAAPAAGAPQAETYDNPNYYYLFDDILVPNGMEHTADEDFTFETQQFKAGVQIFQGRVVFDDLITFFQNNMIKDGWRKVSSVRSKKSILLFEKSNKACIIELVDGFKAKATIFAMEYKSGSSAPAPAAKAVRPSGGQVRPATGSPTGGFNEKDIR